MAHLEKRLRMTTLEFRNLVLQRLITSVAIIVVGVLALGEFTEAARQEPIVNEAAVDAGQIYPSKPTATLVGSQLYTSGSLIEDASQPSEVYTQQSLIEWPISTPNSVTAVAFADLNNDGLLEVIAVSRFNGVYAWNHDGTLLTGWPFLSSRITSDSPAIGDMDGDSVPEIAVAGNY